MKKCCCLLRVAVFIVASLTSYCADGKVITIKGVEGHGKTRQLALVDAFREAISQTLGSYVVSSRQWDGETLDKKIFDNSDAVVKSHKVVDETEVNGQWLLTIDAEIVQNEMMKYIQKETSANVGEGELANLLAKRNAIKNAVGSLTLLFQNWRENVYRIEKYGNIFISDQDDIESDTVHISVPFIVTFRWDSYQMLLNKVKNVLSRIAIGKTRGMYYLKSKQSFGNTVFPFYNEMGLVYKSDYGISTRNPNGYGEIRIVSHIPENTIIYEVYIVPGQVTDVLNSLLQCETEMKFSLASKGGATVASSVANGRMYFWGWNSICGQDVSLGWSNNQNGSLKLITLMDVIKTDFGRDEWSACKLYHAVIPVPLNASERISRCSINVCHGAKSDGVGNPISKSHGFGNSFLRCGANTYHDDGKQECRRVIHVATEIMEMYDWMRVDKKPSPKIRFL